MTLVNHAGLRLQLSTNNKKLHLTISQTTNALNALGASGGVMVCKLG